jgi:hypothetical protein
MQQAVETKVNPLERQLKVAVPVDQLEAEIAGRIRKLARTVKMQGFRPGKVPIKMVERHYGFQVRQEAADSVQRSSRKPCGPELPRGRHAASSRRGGRIRSGSGGPSRHHAHFGERGSRAR